MNSDIMNMFENPGEVYLPGTSQNTGTNWASVTFNADNIRFEARAGSQSGTVTVERPESSRPVGGFLSWFISVPQTEEPDQTVYSFYNCATITTKQKVDRSIFTKGIKLKYELENGSSAARIAILLANKRVQGSNSRYIQSCPPSSSSAISYLYHTFEKIASFDQDFGYRAYAFKHMKPLHGDYDTSLTGGGGAECGELSLCFDYPSLVLNNQIVNNQIIAEGTNDLFFRSWTGGKEVNFNDIYLSIIVLGSQGSVPVKLKITDISDFDYAPAMQNGYVPQEDDGTRYVISKKALSLLNTSINNKKGGTAFSYTPNDMVREIYRLNAVRKSYQIDYIDNVRDLGEMDNQAERVYIFNSQDSNDVYCTNVTKGWSLGSGGFTSVNHGLIQVRQDGALYMGVCGGIAGTSSKNWDDGSGTSIQPICFYPRTKFNIEQLIGLGYKGIKIGIDFLNETMEGNAGAHRFCVYFAPSVSKTSSTNLETAFPDGYKQYYVACKNNINSEITFTGTSSAYCYQKLVAEGENQPDGKKQEITIVFNDSLLEKLPSGQGYIVFAGTRNDTTDSPYVASAAKPYSYNLGSYYDKISYICFIK